MAGILELWQPHSGQHFIISENVQLGRAPDLNWATARQAPHEFGELELAIQIEDNENHSAVSRNHAAVLRTGDPQFSLVDLNSTTGTFLNGKRLPHGGRAVLRLNDRIVLGKPDGGYTLIVGGIKDGHRDYHAILASYMHDNPQGTAASLEALTHELLQNRGFDRKNIAALHGRDTHSEKLFNAISALAPLTTRGSHTLLYLYFHGNGHGIALPDGMLSPSALYSALGRVRGKKAVIVDACNSGVFANKEILPPNALVVASTLPEELSYSASIAPGEPRIGHLTRALLTCMAKHPKKFDLGQVGGYLQGVLGVLAASGYDRQMPVVQESHPTIVTGRSFTMAFPEMG